MLVRCLCAAVVGVLVCTNSIAAASHFDSPAQRLASILAAARAQSSVHYTNTVSGSPPTTKGFALINGDAGKTIGIQHIAFHKAGRVGHVTVVATPVAAFVRGDAFTLVNYMLFSTKAAAKYAGRWIVIPKSASGYPTVSAGVMLTSVVQELALAPPLSMAQSTNVQGEQVFGLRGKVSPRYPYVATLYAKATGAPIPIEERVTIGAATQTTLLSNWNAPVHIVVPTNATPISVVGNTR